MIFLYYIFEYWYSSIQRMFQRNTNFRHVLLNFRENNVYSPLFCWWDFATCCLRLQASFVLSSYCTIAPPAPSDRKRSTVVWLLSLDWFVFTDQLACAPQASGETCRIISYWLLTFQLIRVASNRGGGGKFRLLLVIQYLVHLLIQGAPGGAGCTPQQLNELLMYRYDPLQSASSSR